MIRISTRVVVLLQWQFPAVMTFILLYPWLQIGRFDCHLLVDSDCSQCHWTDTNLFSYLPFSTYGIPISISGIIADNLELQLFCYGSLLYTLLSFVWYVRQHSVQVLAPSSVPHFYSSFLSTLVFFFLCLFAFPLRSGCSQSWFAVLMHLSFLSLSLLAAHEFFNASCSLPLSLSPPPYSSYSLAFRISALLTCASGGLGAVFCAFRAAFAAGEIVILAVFAAWATRRLLEIEGATSGDGRKGKKRD